MSIRWTSISWSPPRSDGVGQAGLAYLPLFGFRVGFRRRVAGAAPRLTSGFAIDRLPPGRLRRRGAAGRRARGAVNAVRRTGIVALGYRCAR